MVSPGASPRTERITVAVIGGGPAGLFVAERLAAAGHRVTVFERMPSPARKFLMAGRGGLNLTHSEPLDRFMTHYNTVPAHFAAAVDAFPPAALVAWADALGAETFVGSSGRVFPKAMKASPLLRAWLRRLAAAGAELRLGHRWTGWSDTGHLLFETGDGARLAIEADVTVLALGGASWPRLGSDAGWVPVLSDAGIEIAPLAPSNVAALVSWSPLFLDRFAGQPLKRAAVTAGGQTRRGELVVTRTGLEGGAIYALSRQLRTELAPSSEARISIDLRPDLDEAQLIFRLGAERGKNSLANHLRKTLRLPPVAISLIREGYNNPLPADPRSLARLVKATPLRVTGLGTLDRAISTAGGVSLDAVGGDYMLKSRPGVFVAGEMLDWEAPTGGYLLQATFSTAAAAAEGALAWLAGRSK